MIRIIIFILIALVLTLIILPNKGVHKRILTYVNETKKAILIIIPIVILVIGMVIYGFINFLLSNS